MPTSRNRAWADKIFNIATLVAATKQDFDLLEDAPTVDTLTVVRIVGSLTFMYSPNSTITDSLSIVHMGIGVSSAEALATGGGALPNPSVQDDYPPRGWLFVDTKPVSQQAESTGVINEPVTFNFDLRAMRKVDKGRLFLSMVQDNVLVGGSMRVLGRTRVLCLT